MGTSQCCGFAAGNATRGDPARFFCPSRPFAAGRTVRAAGLGVESAEIAVPAQRIRSFPHPSKGNSALLKAVGVSRRYKQRMRLRISPRRLPKRSGQPQPPQWVERQGSEAFAGSRLLKHACAPCGCRRLRAGRKARFTGRVRFSTGLRRRKRPTLFGPVTFSRSRLRKFVRRSTKAWVWSTVTSRAAYRALLVMDHCTPRDAAKLFEKLGGMNPSSSHLRRLLVTAGNLWKEKGEAALDTKAKPVPTEAVSFAVSLDGSRMRCL